MAKIAWSQVAVAVIAGAILGAGAAFYGFSSRISYLEGVVAAAERGSTGSSAAPKADSPETATEAPALAPQPPDSLIAVVSDLQRRYVRESFGEQAGQNFSDQDLAAFRADGVPAGIVDSLRHDARFLSVVLGLKTADAAVQQSVLNAANRPLRRTWGEIGRVTREGQTEAGNQAERLIAEAVVTLSRELLRLPEADLRRLAVR